MRLTTCSRIPSSACLLALIALPALARAQGFERVPATPMFHDGLALDARSCALGGVVVAAPEGPADIWWNPAALMTGRAVQVQYAPLSSLDDFELRTVAVAGEWRNLRLAVAHTGWDTDPLPVRTAYEPEGNGQFLDVGGDTWTINAGADLAPWLLRGRDDFNLALGVSARRLSSFLDVFDGDSTDMAAWDMDAGLLAARLWRGPQAWVRLRAAVVARNALGTDVDDGGYLNELPRRLRFGLAAEAGSAPMPGQRAPFRVLLGYGREESLNEDYMSAVNWLGLEATLFELLALRGSATGSSSRSYGLGLLLARPGALPCGLRLDYAHERWEFWMGMDGWHDQWSMTLHWDRL